MGGTRRGKQVYKHRAPRCNAIQRWRSSFPDRLRCVMTTTRSRYCIRWLADAIIGRRMHAIVIARGVEDRLSRRVVYDELPAAIMELQVNIEIALTRNYYVKLYRTLPGFPTASSLSSSLSLQPPKLPEVTPPNLAQGKSMVQELLSLSAYFHFS